MWYLYNCNYAVRPACRARNKGSVIPASMSGSLGPGCTMKAFCGSFQSVRHHHRSLSKQQSQEKPLQNCTYRISLCISTRTHTYTHTKGLMKSRWDMAEGVCRLLYRLCSANHCKNSSNSFFFQAINLNSYTFESQEVLVHPWIQWTKQFSTSAYKLFHVPPYKQGTPPPLTSPQTTCLFVYTCVCKYLWQRANESLFWRDELQWLQAETVF